MAKRLKTAQREIFTFLDQLPTKVLRRSDIATILENQSNHWSISTGTSAFIKFLTEQGQLKKVSLPFPAPYKKETRYAWGNITLYEICLSVKPNGHYSHYTAIRLHGLTEQLPKTMYLNVEQANKSISSGTLTQASIDSALRRPPRSTKQIAEIDGHRLVILQGKNTGNFGVVTQSVATDPQHPSVTLRFTDLERTLIDAAVRPQYAGGVAEVLKAFEIARTKLSIARLAETLEKLDYIYPYHQVIGFYLERAGYTPDETAPLKRLPIEFDFQLAHGLRDTRYVEDWRLRVPVGF